MRATATLSDAVAAKLTNDVASDGSVKTEMSLGQVMLGVSMSLTVTVKVQDAAF
jgi:hypothetical protein